MRYQNSLIVALSASFSAMFLSFMIHSPWSNPNIYSDIGSFWIRSEIHQGLVPYFNFFFEYPPISGYILYLARIVGGNYNGYYSAFGVMSLVAALVLAWSCWRVANALGTRLNPLYFFFPSLIIYGVYNFDLFNALFIILSLQFFLEDRKDASAAALGLSIATKLVGVVLLPIYLLELWKLKEPKAEAPIMIRSGSQPLAGQTSKEWGAKGGGYLGRLKKASDLLKKSWSATLEWLRRNRLMLEYLLITAAVVAFFFLPIAILNFSFLHQFYAAYAGHGLEDAWYIWIFQDPHSVYAGWFGLAVTGILLLRVYTLRVSLAPRVFLGLAAYLLGATIYSPQFNLMLIPLVIVLAIDDPSLYAWEVFNALIILTWFVGTTNPWLPGTIPQTMALLRTGSLAWLCLALLHRSGIRPVELLPSFLRQPSLQDFSPKPQIEQPHEG
ncbi:MAG: hypothetical protein ABSB26_06005 [Nitrososphaerales archaeon]